MADAQVWFKAKCTICHKKLRGATSHEEAYGQMLWHLPSSTTHPMEEAEACQHIADNETCIWEDGEGTLEEPEEEKPRLRSRSRDRRDDRRGEKGDGNRDDRRKGGGKGQESKGKKGYAVVPYQGKGSRSMSWRDQQIVEVTRERVIESVVGEQQERVFAFAKTLGKCEAVIRTATRVARQAVSAFED